MSLVQALLASVALGTVSRATAPRMPAAAAPPQIDLDAETLKARETRRAASDPNLLEALRQQGQTALTLSRGELPPEIEATIRRVSAENAVTRGLSPGQTTRMTAQAMGQTQLQMMERGAALTQSLQQIADTEWAVAADSALGKANQFFEAYSIKETQKLAKWTQQSKEHGNFWGGLTQMATMGMYIDGKYKSPPAKKA
jgi:hypothetical protein